MVGSDVLVASVAVLGPERRTLSEQNKAEPSYRRCAGRNYPSKRASVFGKRRAHVVLQRADDEKCYR